MNEPTLKDLKKMSNIDLSKPPQLKMTLHQTGAPATLEGWEELDRWAMFNNTVWHRVKAGARNGPFTDIDTLRLLAAELLRRNLQLEEDLARAVRSHPEHVMLAMMPIDQPK